MGHTEIVSRLPGRQREPLQPVLWRGTAHKLSGTRAWSQLLVEANRTQCHGRDQALYSIPTPAQAP